MSAKKKNQLAETVCTISTGATSRVRPVFSFSRGLLLIGGVERDDRKRITRLM